MEFNVQLQKNVEEINEIIKKSLPNKSGFQKKVIDAANYSVLAGGKRLRPMLILEAYRLCNGKEESICYPFMAAMECIHTYSLVHDDLPAMDNDDYRRGQLTTHKKFGEDFGILAGDALLNYAYEIIFDYINKIDDIEIKNRAISAACVIAKKAGIYGMVGGQAVDVELTNKSISPEQLDFIFHLKTGALIEASFMTGAILAGASKEIIDNLETAANRIGFAFQIKDDILDVESSQEVLGKPVNSDLKNNKTTYVTIYGLNKAHADVLKLSQEALQIISKTGNNEFLNELVLKLINRKK